MSRIDIATVNDDSKPKSIFARVYEAEGAPKDALEQAVATLDDDAPVAYRVCNDNVGIREAGLVTADIGEWVACTAGKLAAMAIAAIVKAATPKAPKPKARR